MAGRLTKQCHECHQVFKKSELIDYASPNAKTMYSYCSKCLAEKQERDRFAEQICMIFGIKAPGPVIWTGRKRLREEYGYTDDTILKCVDYIYNVRNFKKQSESLVLVTPKMVQEMKDYRRTIEKRVADVNQNYNRVTFVPKEKEEPEPEYFDPDDFLDD